MKRPEQNAAPEQGAALQKKTAEEKEGNYYVYLLLCSDGSYYCGYTDDPERRLAVHNSGKGAKYTRSRRPCTLVYTEKFDTKHDAMRREFFLKKLDHRQREQLVKDVAAVRSMPERKDAAAARKGAADGGTEDPVRGR